MAITVQPKNYHGRCPIVDSNLVLRSGTALPNATNAISSYIEMPKHTGGKYRVIFWNAETTDLVLGSKEDLKLEVLRHYTNSGTGITCVNQSSRTPDYYFQRAGAGVFKGVIFDKTGRTYPELWKSGEIVASLIIDEDDLQKEFTGLDYKYIAVRVTTTCDLSAKKLSAAIVPIV